MVTIKIKKLNELTKQVEYFRNHVLRVGMVSNPHLTSQGLDSNAKKKSPDGKTSPKTMAEILAIHVEGRKPMPNSPARDPITPVMDNRQADYGREMNAILGQMFKGKASAELVLAGTGETIVQLFRETVKAHLPPPLTEARKKQKRKHGKSADTPLIFGGQLQGSWRYEIRKESRVI